MYLPASQTPPSIAKVPHRHPARPLVCSDPIPNVDPHLAYLPPALFDATSPRAAVLVALRWSRLQREAEGSQQDAPALLCAARFRRESPTWWRGRRREEFLGEGGVFTVAMFAGAQRSPALETRSLFLSKPFSPCRRRSQVKTLLLFSCWRRLSSPDRWDVGARPLRADEGAASTRNLFLSLSRLLPLGNGLNGPRCEHCGIDIPSRPPVAVPGPPWR